FPYATLFRSRVEDDLQVALLAGEDVADAGDVARFQAGLGQGAERYLRAQFALAAHDLGDGLLQSAGGGQTLLEVHAAADRQRRREERLGPAVLLLQDRKSTRLNSSHVK